MANSVYLKANGLTTEERKMVRALEKFSNGKLKAEPGFEMPKAHNLAELKSHYLKYCTEETQVISETKNPVKPKEVTVEDHTGNEETKNPEIRDVNDDAELYNKKEPMAEEVQDAEFVDPLVRSNPNIREYVTAEDNMKRPEELENKRKESTGEIPEPTSFDDAFGFGGDSSAPKPGQKQEKRQTPPPKQYEPVNPNFDDMNKSKKNKQTKRFAKYIVEATAMLTEKGCIWWTTKDINDIKLTEYDLEKTVNLEIMLTLSEDQQMTVRQFFKMQCQIAETAYTFTPEEKEELSDALYDVMLERGLAPTPMQTLMMVALGIIGKRVFTAFITKVQINSILKNPLVSPPKEDEPEQVAPPEKKPEAPVQEQRQEPKPKAPRKQRQTNIIDEDSRDIDPEKVMNGEQIVGVNVGKVKRPHRAKMSTELTTT